MGGAAVLWFSSSPLSTAEGDRRPRSFLFFFPPCRTPNRPRWWSSPYARFGFGSPSCERHAVDFLRFFPAVATLDRPAGRAAGPSVSPSLFFHRKERGVHASLVFFRMCPIWTSRPASCGSRLSCVFAFLPSERKAGPCSFFSRVKV